MMQSKYCCMILHQVKKKRRYTMKRLTKVIFAALVAVTLSLPVWAQAPASNTQTKTTKTQTTTTAQTKEQKKQAAKEKKEAAKAKKQADKDAKGSAKPTNTTK